MRVSVPFPAVAASVALAATLTGCDSPSRPTPPAVVATPAPTPAPTPVPPASLGCGAPPVANPALDCPRTSGSYQHIVTEALRRLAEQSPELFDFGDRRGSLGFYIKDHPAYYAGVLAHIRAQGACAVFDGEEIALKMNNEFSDQ